MSSAPRPLLLGYIRAHALPAGVLLPQLEAELGSFAAREDFCLGTVYVERDGVAGAFREMLVALDRDESAVGVVVPGLHHLTSNERQILSACQYGAGLTILVAHVGHTPPI